MKKINKKGLSSIEILLAFVLTSIIVVSMFNVVFSFRTRQQEESARTDAITYINTITRVIHSDLIEHGIQEVREIPPVEALRPGEERLDYVIVLNTGEERVLRVTKIVNSDESPTDEKFVLHYDGIDYPLPNIGRRENGGQIEYDLKFNELRLVVATDYETNNQTMLTLFIGLHHPDLGSNYAIRIVSPVGMPGASFHSPIIRERPAAAGWSIEYNREWDTPYEGSLWTNSETITDIVISPVINIPPNANQLMDVSREGNNSVFSYMEGNTLHIQANGNIIFPENSSNFFRGFPNLKSIEGLEHIDTSKVTNMSGMFEDLPRLEKLNVRYFDVTNVTTMRHLFRCGGPECFHDLPPAVSCHNGQPTYEAIHDQSELILDVSLWDTPHLVNMLDIFRGQVRIRTLDMGNFDTSKVTDMQGLFACTFALTELNISNFDTSSATTMNGMFYDARSIEELDLSSFDTSNVLDMNRMFWNAVELRELDLSNFNTSRVTDMRHMFRATRSITRIKVDRNNWVMPPENTALMFEGSGVNSVTFVN